MSRFDAKWWLIIQGCSICVYATLMIIISAFIRPMTWQTALSAYAIGQFCLQAFQVIYALAKAKPND